MSHLPDQAARDRIVHDLDTNLLVEAGAGSGKTHSLVERMVALVETGAAEVGEIAAVTFTRKAAGELRERFQLALEARLAGVDADPERSDRLGRALREIDAAFIGTIHAFCARLLRERPLEAGLDPGFQELPEEVAARLTSRFWAGHLERLTASDDPRLARVRESGLDVRRMERVFVELSNEPEVDFGAADVPRPSDEEIGAVREALELLTEHGARLLPEEEPEAPDDVYLRVQALRYRRDMGWEDERSFFEALAYVCRKRRYKLVQYKWGADVATKEAAKRLKDGFETFSAEGSQAQRLMERWRTYRYPLVVELATDAARAWSEERRRLGLLSFQDLLTYAVALLRSGPDARSDLGRRYRRVLVDEFQDTDPIQAEILLLLASEPTESDAAWLELVPRPGGLFVVGDPKQSIYRFRRADIAVYGLVKERFAHFGAVLRLEANFRSRPAVAAAVNGIFDDPELFGAEETPAQAAFAPLLPERGVSDGASGVFHYELEGSGGWRAVAEDDAARLATWIVARTEDGGDRAPGDFLILTRRLRELEIYARALEERGLPVAVSGAGVGIERELSELVLVLQALADPTDPVKTVACLVGLFFGLDHEQLLAHRAEGGGYSFTSTYGPRTPVGDALHRLNRWWEVSRREPADVFIGRLVSELGLLPYAASGSLGQLRAGALVYLLDAVRESAIEGSTSLPGALDALTTALSAADAESPLQPGLPGAVRVMNLHKAKGLEAPVVVLAAPTGASYRHPIDKHIERRSDGSARGYMVIERREKRTTTVEAMPPGWPEKREAERAFGEAEDVRLVYVAATRAQDELVVARNADKPVDSPWRLMDRWFLENGTRLDLEPTPPPPPPPFMGQVQDIQRTVRRADRARRRMSQSGYEFLSATAVAKTGAQVEGQLALAFTDPETAGVQIPSRGVSWGTSVHGALAAASRDPDAEALRAICRTLLVENERPLTEDGEPAELEELLDLVSSVRTGSLWSRARKSGRRLVEVPFSTLAPEAWALGDGVAEPARLRHVEGVIDLVFQEEDGWVIADYKTDVRTDPGFERREAGYRAQVELYAACWEKLTGETVKERILFYTNGGVQQVW